MNSLNGAKLFQQSAAICKIAPKYGNRRSCSASNVVRLPSSIAQVTVFKEITHNYSVAGTTLATRSLPLTAKSALYPDELKMQVAECSRYYSNFKQAGYPLENAGTLQPDHRAFFVGSQAS